MCRAPSPRLLRPALGILLAVHPGAAIAAPETQVSSAPQAATEEELRPGRAGLRPTGAVVGTPASTAPKSEGKGGGVAAAGPAEGAPVAEIVWENPVPPAADLSPRWVPIAPSDRNRSSADAGVLEGVRVLSLGRGEARLKLASEPAPRALRVGDRVGTFAVVGIEAGRIVLTRPAGPGETGDALAVVKAGRDGLGFVRVYTSKDPATSAGGAGEAR